MSALDALAPDQRAVIQLVLQQRRSYTDLANLLGISVEAVRTRAHAGLAALAATPAPAEQGALSDYLLGQGDGDGDDARSALAQSPDARSWASEVATALATVPGAQLPPLPEPEPQPEEPQPEPAGRPLDELLAESARRPSRRSTAPSSKIGGAILIAVVVALVIIGAILLLGGDDEEPSASATATPSATSTAAPPTVVGTIDLVATGKHKGKATMTLFTQDGQLGFTIEGSGLAANGANDAYAVWLTSPDGKPVNLGFAAPVDDDGSLGLSGPQDKDLEKFPSWLANSRAVVLSKETTQDAKEPEEVVLRGRVPRGSG